MSALFNSSPLVLGALQNLSLILDRSTSMSPSPVMSGLTPSTNEARSIRGRRNDRHPKRSVRACQGTLRRDIVHTADAGICLQQKPRCPFGDRQGLRQPQAYASATKSKGHERPISSRGENSCHFSPDIGFENLADPRDDQGSPGRASDHRFEGSRTCAVCRARWCSRTDHKARTGKARWRKVHCSDRENGSRSLCPQTADLH